MSVIAELIIGMPFVADRAVLFAGRGFFADRAVLLGCGLLRIEQYVCWQAICC